METARKVIFVLTRRYWGTLSGRAPVGARTPLKHAATRVSRVVAMPDDSPRSGTISDLKKYTSRARFTRPPDCELSRRRRTRPSTGYAATYECARPPRHSTHSGRSSSSTPSGSPARRSGHGS